jgi:peptide deformylase
MVLKIVQLGEPVLRRAARELTREEIRSAAVQQLIEMMRQTMYDAPGVGLAAPQIGLALQLAVLEDREELLRALDPQVLAERDRKPVPFTVVINPRIELEGSQAEFFEGCLSMSGFTAIVPRSLRARVHCLDENGDEVSIEASGWHARILQHEIDHLYGTVYVDRMLPRSLMTADNLARYWKSKPVTEIRNALGL